MKITNRLSFPVTGCGDRYVIRYIEYLCVATIYTATTPSMHRVYNLRMQKARNRLSYCIFNLLGLDYQLRGNDYYNYQKLPISHQTARAVFPESLKPFILQLL